MTILAVLIAFAAIRSAYCLDEGMPMKLGMLCLFETRDGALATAPDVDAGSVLVMRPEARKELARAMGWRCEGGRIVARVERGKKCRR